MAENRRNIKLTSLDDLFSTEESRAEEEKERIQEIPIAEIDGFPEHPFHVDVDDAMREMVESIKRFGVLSPAVARQKEDGRYELISGHRRKKACELAGIEKMPVIVRMSVGSKYGAQHSQDWSALCAHIPGLKVVFPATPYDAKGMMQSALNGTDPVIFFESQRIYDKGEEFHEGGVPEGTYEIRIGDPDIKKPGKDITILTIGAVLYRALEAAKILEEKYGISAEVIDARSIVPFDYDKVIESVKKTGKIVLVGDACERGSVMRDMASNIAEFAFDYLDAPPVVVASRNWITPAHELEKYFFPQADTIIDAIHEKIMPIAGYTPTHNFTTIEKMRRSKEGV